jgi:hypothetical protein
MRDIHRGAVLAPGQRGRALAPIRRAPSLPAGDIVPKGLTRTELAKEPTLEAPQIRDRLARAGRQAS